MAPPAERTDVRCYGRLGQNWWIVAAGLLVGSSFADTVILRPVADTTLFELVPTNNLGAVLSLPVGTINQGRRCRMLLRFDIGSAVPAGAMITAASLKVVVQRGTGPDSVFELRRMLQPWNEGTKGSEGSTGDPATEGETTWAFRVFPAVPWSAEGGQAGLDFSTEPSGALLFQGPGEYTFASGSGLIADLQGWLDQPATNQGWLLWSVSESTPSTSRRIASREDPADGPVLSVEFVPPSLAPRFDRVERAGDEIRLHFAVEAGKLYAIEFNESVPGTNWVLLGNAASKFYPTNWVTVDSRLNAPQRTYRLAIVADID